MSKERQRPLLTRNYREPPLAASFFQHRANSDGTGVARNHIVVSWHHQDGLRICPERSSSEDKVTTGFTVRRATVADAATIARHRAEMFADMKTLPRSLCATLVSASIPYLAQRIPTEEYLGWLAVPSDAPGTVLAGAGVLQRQVPPHPRETPEGVVLAEGRQGIVLNVYTERAWRRRGLARLLMRHVLEWAASTEIETLVLHASDDGRPLYERLGFVASNEMRYPGKLLQGRFWEQVGRGDST